ncbi:MAG: hypothetical protein C0631_18490 [Sedimenticola sp.]|nr:MAG: hypothetical protein C0631_18490 [Sedimenticola sp.]
MGMSINFAAAIHAEGAPALFSQLAKSAIDTLSDEDLAYCSNAAREILITHGFKNIRRGVVVESGNAFIVIDKYFAPRPRPLIKKSPYYLENAKIIGLKYSRGNAVISSPKEGVLTVSVLEDKSILLDQLHAAGKTSGLLQCLIREVVSAQNTIDYELLSVQLQSICE